MVLTALFLVGEHPVLVTSRAVWISLLSPNVYKHKVE